MFFGIEVYCGNKLAWLVNCGKRNSTTRTIYKSILNNYNEIKHQITSLSTRKGYSLNLTQLDLFLSRVSIQCMQSAILLWQIRPPVCPMPILRLH